MSRKKGIAMTHPTQGAQSSVIKYSWRPNWEFRYCENLKEFIKIGEWKPEMYKKNYESVNG